MSFSPTQQHVPNRWLWVHQQPEAGVYREVRSLVSGCVNPLAFPELEVRIERLLPGR